MPKRGWGAFNRGRKKSRFLSLTTIFVGSFCTQIPVCTYFNRCMKNLHINPKNNLSGVLLVPLYVPSSIQTDSMLFYVFFLITNEVNKRPKMGLYRSPDIHWCHGQEYRFEDLVKKLDTSVLTSLY